MQFLKSNEGRRKLQAGVDKLADAAKVTLGPRGRNVMFRKDGQTIITNDGVTIVSNIELDDPVERDAANIVQQVALETNNIAGDGTTTATLLAQALLEACLNEIENSKIDPILLRNQLHEALEDAVKKLEEMSTKLTPDQIVDVARVSVGGNEELAKLVADAIKKVGKGPIGVENSEKLGAEIEVTKGFEDVGGLATPYMANDKGVAISINTPALVIDGTLDDPKHIIPVMNQLVKKGEKQLVIYAQDFSNTVLRFLIDNTAKGIITTIAIKAVRLEDIAEAVGATAVSQIGVVRLENITIDVVGKTKKAVADSYRSITVGSSGKGKLKIGTIKLGRPTEVEYQEQAHRLEDAINAVRAAQEQGILPGGGVPLDEVASEISFNGLGHSLLAEAMRQPKKQIRENGFLGDVEPGVVDPLKVVTTALRNAVSAVSTLITTEVIVYQEDFLDGLND
jgi:chaperonin GroEL